MTAATVEKLAARPAAAPWQELADREPTLWALGLAHLLAVPAVLLAMQFDDRLLGEVSVWAKPLKFLVSIALFALTLAWFVGYVAPRRRRSSTIRWMVRIVVATASFEMLYIAFQASRGEASHFNVATPVHAALYGAMGTAAMVLTAAPLLLAWEVWRNPRPGLDAGLRLSVVVGLVLTFVLGAGAGGYIGSAMSPIVGTAAEMRTMPILGWALTVGDLRPAHFLGIHAMQAIPALGAAVAGMAWGRSAVVAGALAYSGLTVLVFVRALAGLPLLG